MTRSSLCADVKTLGIHSKALVSLRVGGAQACALLNTLFFTPRHTRHQTQWPTARKQDLLSGRYPPRSLLLTSPIGKLPSEIISNIFQFLPHDTITAANVVEVCKVWQFHGANLVWRRATLRDLLHYISDPQRVAGFASQIETLHFGLYQAVLADARIKTFNFTRLQKVQIYGHNLSFAGEDTLKALITPALKVFEVLEDFDAPFRQAPNDDNVWLALLVPVAHQITGLRFLDFTDVRRGLLHDFLLGAIHLERIRIGYDHSTEMTYHDLICILTSPKLDYLDLPKLFEIDTVDVDSLFNHFGPDWSLPAMRVLERLSFNRGAGRAAARLLPIFKSSQ
ncbi:hypothetical protein VTO58DRAFT_108412 [Aureobasidium pullulans]